MSANITLGSDFVKELAEAVDSAAETIHTLGRVEDTEVIARLSALANDLRIGLAERRLDANRPSALVIELLSARGQLENSLWFLSRARTQAELAGRSKLADAIKWLELATGRALPWLLDEAYSSNEVTR